MNSLAGVYEVQCNCGGKYIGETSTKVSTRIKQHQKDIFQAKWKNSGLSEHASKCSERIDWTGAKTISIECNHFSRKVREALEIQLRKPQMNRDDGDYVTTRCWEPLLAKMRKTSLRRQSPPCATTTFDANDSNWIESCFKIITDVWSCHSWIKAASRAAEIFCY